MVFIVRIGNDWDEILADEWQKPYYLNLREQLKSEYKNHTVYPKMHDIFNALKYTSFKDVKCVIIGQDPYHGENQAHGLCFSVMRPPPPPPSLKNIFKEYQDDLGFVPNYSNGELTSWAKNGVLMLNTLLTVRSGEPLSHKGLGWEKVTDRIISEINKKQSPVVFNLWGRPAAKKAEIIDNPKHLKLFSVHPSPLSAFGGFFGSKPFSKANEYLISNGISPIDWKL